MRKKIDTALAILLAVLFLVGSISPALAVTGTRQVVGVIDGKKKKYKVPLNEATYQTLFNLPDYTCREFGYTSDEALPACYNFLIYDRADQKEALASLVVWLNKKIKNKGDRVRAAVSLVQNMPYDYTKSTGEETVATGRGHGSRYPYETLYENTGICGEKARLIVYLLKQLGYGTATITFTSPSLHEVAGVKCPPAYDFRDTGYCFIDPNIRHMITFGGSYENYEPYQILQIADGKTLNAKKDYQDSRKYWEIINSIDAGTYTAKQAKAYRKLIKKYGL